jgi:carbon monoxide dehydrogenase subunit G
MSRTVATRVIQAPVATVFNTVADVRQLAQALPVITNVEFLTSTTSGVGTRYRQTRGTDSRAATYEMEVTEFVPNDHVRIVTQPGGTVWDSVFSVTPAGADRTALTLAMEGHTTRLLSRLLNFMIGGMLRRAIEADMDKIAAYCERIAGEAATPADGRSG